MYMGDRPEIPPPHHPLQPLCPLPHIYNLKLLSLSCIKLCPTSTPFLIYTFYNIELFSLSCTVNLGLVSIKHENPYWTYTTVPRK
jgi:hypothetical protein